jgi:hypothetical protein
VVFGSPLFSFDIPFLKVSVRIRDRSPFFLAAHWKIQVFIQQLGSGLRLATEVG